MRAPTDRSSERPARMYAVYMVCAFALFAMEARATTCAGATPLNPAVLPITNQALVCGAANDLNSTNVPGTLCGTGDNAGYKNGNEALYVITPTITGLYSINVNGQAWSSIQVWAGCPTSGGTCVFGDGNVGTTTTINVNLNAGTQYYIWFDTWPTPNSPCPGTFSMTPPVSAPAYDNPCGATSLNVGTSCSFSLGTNAGATATTGVAAPTCGSYAGGDVWYSAVVPASGQLIIDSNSGTLTDGGMALYTAPSCSGPFTQVACDDDGSANGLMPMISASGLAAGSTVYIRMWGYAGATGSFSICAYGSAVTPPPGGCIYTLTLTDSFGDGWGSSAVGVSINGGAYTWYTVAGTSNTVQIPVGVGNIVAIQYNNSGAWQGENSYTITLGGGVLFSSGSPPTAGLVFTNVVTCQPPPAPPEDCIGGITLCSGQSFSNNTSGTGAVADLNFTSAGCLSALERQGTWYNFSPSSGGTIGFTINPANPLDDYDFALWGPFPPGSSPSTICPPLGAPLRCSFAAPSGATGLNNTATDQTEGPAGDKWVQQLTVTTGQVYLLYISNFSMSGLSFNLSWQLGAGASLDCTVLPVELIALTATPADDRVIVEWSTASESGVSHFELERSLDGEHFSRIGTVAAHGHSSATVRYQLLDEHPASGLNFYRLRSVDQDAGASTSQTVTAWMGSKSEAIRVVPNPTDQFANAMVHLPGDGSYAVRLIDGQGRVVRELSLQGLAGTNTIALDLKGCDAGAYQLLVTDPGGVLVARGRFVRH